MYKKMLSKSFFTLFVVAIVTSLTPLKAFAIDFDKPDPNCPHNNIGETFNQPYPCELGDAEDILYVYCKDCGGLLEEKIAVKESLHGEPNSIRIDENGNKICTICNRPVEEVLDLKEGIVKKEEVPKYLDEAEKMQTVLYPIIESNKKNYEEYKAKSKAGIFQTEMTRYRKIKFITGENKKLELLNVSKLDENYVCKGEHIHLIADITQSRDLNSEDANCIINYKCLDCIYEEEVVYDKDEIDTIEKRKAIAAEKEELKEFWYELGMLDEEAEESNLSFFEKIIAFIKSLFK